MFSLTVSAQGASALDAARTMREHGVGMTLLADDSDTLVGTFSETHFKRGVSHDTATAAADLSAASIGGEGVLVASAATPLIGAVHDLLGSGARYAMLLREGAEAEETARDGVVMVGSVRRSDVRAVVSVRDMVRQAARVRTAAGKAAEEAAAGAAEGDEAAAALAEAARAALGKESAALDVRAFGCAVPDAAAALGALSKGRGRASYFNCPSTDTKTSAADAMASMASNAVSAVILLGDDASLAGLYTVRDHLWKVIAPGGGAAPLDPASTPISGLMTAAERHAAFDWTIERCARVMCKRGLTHLPLADDGAFVGLLSLADVARFAVKAPFPGSGEDAAALRADAVAHFARLEELATAAHAEPRAARTEADASQERAA